MQNGKLGHPGNTSYRGVLNQMNSLAKGNGPLDGDSNGLSTVIQGLTDFVVGKSGMPADQSTEGAVKEMDSQGAKGTDTTVADGKPAERKDTLVDPNPQGKEQIGDFQVDKGAGTVTRAPAEDGPGAGKAKKAMSNKGGGIIETLFKVFTAGMG